MMTLYVKNVPEDCITQTDLIFNLAFEDEWFEDPEVIQMVKDIDDCDVINAGCIENGIYPHMSCTSLSGDVKGLIMIKHCEEYRNYRSNIFGDNCVPWLVKLSFVCDFGFYMRHPIGLYKAGIGGAPICAKTEEGELINSTLDIWKYYLANNRGRGN